ncbi:Uncharacterised protein [Legionella steigerwaltii]|uniref:Uncharacterized protein n=1 Tax=Legionella steigerwaltii TaxID=460 RepID=A0A378L4E7_9GAMM|nr:hypothetical protein [Legionella steigerwaltii]KTD71988.1 hypothetical protein Lstg_2689 [Legionella steigerwaltii]STY21654.1 Uncharacterised protein [Legionella steigerwaltii]
MSIFKDITYRYCKKILDAYQVKADEKTYKGKEAELLIQRNELARGLIESIKEIEVNEGDHTKYFDQVLNTITAKLKEVETAVSEYNKKFKTSFTTDLYETFFTASLISFIKALNTLVQNSPVVILNIEDKSLFSNKKDSPWFYYFSFVLYEYILEKELDFATNKTDRDIFDAKKGLILKYILNAGNLYTRFAEDESNAEYKELMKVLLKSMDSDEKDIQRRKTEETNASSSLYSYFAPSFHKASEKLVGRNQLGQKLELLIKDFNEKSETAGLTV